MHTGNPKTMLEPQFTLETPNSLCKPQIHTALPTAMLETLSPPESPHTPPQL